MVSVLVLVALAGLVVVAWRSKSVAILAIIALPLLVFMAGLGLVTAGAVGGSSAAPGSRKTSRRSHR